MPQIKQRNFDNGVLIGTKALVANLMPIVTDSNRQSLNVADSQRRDTDLKLSLFLLGLGSIIVVIIMVFYWYKSGRKVQHNYDEQPKNLESENSNKKIHCTTNKPRPVAESATDIFEVEEVLNLRDNYYNHDSSSNSDCGSSNDSSNSHDNSSSNDCGSSYDSSSDCGSSYDSSSW